MLAALKSYLTNKGHKNIHLDFIPDEKKQLSAIGLFKWDYAVGNINDGTGIQYIQIQCRDGNYERAKDTCSALFNLLDSGTEETLIHLTEDVFCVARPRRGPLVLKRNEISTTFYCEIALWGRN